MAEPSRRERLIQDLGLGGKMSERSRARLLNHDGMFNVRRNNLGPFHSYDAYHTLISLPIPRPLALMIVGYVVTNLVFASLYWPAGPGALSGAADPPLGRFVDRVFFSVQTLATIGYGKLVPNAPAANLLVAIEALVGLLGFAILSALLFARFTRPTARIGFSRNAIIFMPLHSVVVHPITDASPLRGLMPETLAAAEPEVVCLISAADETFAQTVHARTSYDKSDIVWGARFRDMYLTDAVRVAIDLDRLHDIEPVPPPASI
jgi:inward rectifier potassium channel